MILTCSHNSSYRPICRSSSALTLRIIVHSPIESSKQDLKLVSLAFKFSMNGMKFLNVDEKVSQNSSGRKGALDRLNSQSLLCM